MSRSVVVVGMSGGVDSSVSAALLKEAGYEVIGMMLRLWSEPGRAAANRCCAPDAMALARRVAARLEIPFYVIDAQEPFRQEVVSYFIEGYAQGITPNPCLVCNRRIRWGFLYEHARALGAEYLATGHYARLRQGPEGKIQLLRSVDPAKDQSYVLHVLDQEKLAHSLFPVGEYPKPQVRALAAGFGLPVASRPDSQDLCFLADSDVRSFLQRNAPEVQQVGPILNRRGEQIGEHQGLAFYTIGQRKGLGVPSSLPLFVLEKDLEHNALIVGVQAELGNQSLQADQVRWVSGIIPEQPFRAQIKIRYKAVESWGRVTPLSSDRVHVDFEQPLRDITAGQAAVFYDGEVCLGGGLIQPPVKISNPNPE